MISNKIHEAVFKKWADEGVKPEHLSMVLELAYDMGIKEGKAMVVKNAIDFISK